MLLGIKVGPQKTSIPDLIATGAPFCEVYLDINRLNEYDDLFDYLKTNRIETGLHYWASVSDKIWSNIAYPDNRIINESMSLIQKTIDIAQKSGFVYVNIHPGSRALVRFDMINQTFDLIKDPVPLNQSISLFLENAAKLDAYAKARNIVLTIETVPARVTNYYWQKPRSEQTPINVYELPVEALYRAQNLGISIANDFGHTAASIVTDNLEAIRRHLFEASKMLARSTRLIHLGFVAAPFNGTDFHDTLTNPVLDTDAAIPNKNQMFDLFKIFPENQKIWILVEPNASHVENYFAARKLLLKAGILDKIPGVR
jgi:sugar phosphate isomerase/epimerase